MCSNLNFWTSYNTKIFKIIIGFRSKLKPYDSFNLVRGRACLYGHVVACQLYLKKPSGNNNIDLLDHLYGAILCDSDCGFIALASSRPVLNFACSRRFVLHVDFCYKTIASIKFIRLEVSFCVLGPCGERNRVSASWRPRSRSK